ncbi:unnamed protein product [marine sediment metagenome]|uniref:Uncharacterized protein n=1 Tax=marine sediment metagenome TaxID=412755 RepID=X1MFV3_9ZZZZ
MTAIIGSYLQPTKRVYYLGFNYIKPDIIVDSLKQVAHLDLSLVL